MARLLALLVGCAAIWGCVGAGPAVPSPSEAAAATAAAATRAPTTSPTVAASPPPTLALTPAPAQTSVGVTDPDIQLLTGPPDHDGSCFASATGSGLLVVDPTYGTAIIGHDSMVELGDGSRWTVAWRPGFTARRNGAEVEVLDPQGNVVATTGQSYEIDGGFAGPGGANWPELRTQVFWACDKVRPLP